MSYLAISDFKYGMDRRRKRVSGVPGTLWSLKNGVISRGGDIESVKKFVPTYTLPAGTFGMWKIRSQIYVFGSADLAASMPRGVQYQRLQWGGQSMLALHDVRSFAGKLYVVAEFDDGHVFHYYNGTRITDWDAIADGNSSLTTVADYLAAKVNATAAVRAETDGPKINITARTPGVAFTISGFVVNSGADNTQTVTVTTPIANVAAVSEIKATGTVTITGGTLSPNVNMVTSVKANGVELLHANVNALSSTSATAAAVAASITSATSVHGYSAVAIGSIVTISAPPGTGATPNGYAIATTAAGNVTMANSGTLSGGVTAVSAVAQVSVYALSGTYEALDNWVITINGAQYAATGRASGMGLSALNFKRRMWSPAGTLLAGSKLIDPSNFSDSNAASGRVSIDVSNESEGSERLAGLEEYSGFMAVFARTTIRLYNIDTDASKIAFAQSVPNTGTLSARAITPQGDDLFYLTPTGVRSLKPRSGTTSPYVADVGTVIDPFVQAWIKAQPPLTVSRAVSIIEPIDGRYMLAVGSRVFVLSYFPGSKVTAWSYMEPGFTISDFVKIGDKLYARAGNTIYLYGGANGDTYLADGEEVSVELPFLAAGKNATEKLLQGFDFAAENEWHLEVLPDPEDETKIIDCGRFVGTTYHEPNLAAVGRSTHFAFKLTCDKGGAASLSSMALHFDGEPDE